MTEQQYIAECMALFGAARYGWTVWEEEAAHRGYQDDVSTADAVARMNHNFACRRADRRA